MKGLGDFICKMKEEEEIAAKKNEFFSMVALFIEHVDEVWAALLMEHAE